jgi:hypothetical protein
MRAKQASDQAAIGLMRGWIERRLGRLRTARRAVTPPEAPRGALNTI